MCDLLTDEAVPWICFESNPTVALRARQQGLPVFFGDVRRPEVLVPFARARLVVLALDDKTAINKAVVTLRRAAKETFGERDARADLEKDDARVAAEAARTRGRLPQRPLILARAVDDAHRSRLQADPLGALAMVPRLPEDSALISLPFAGAALRALGVNNDEVDELIETRRRDALRFQGLDTEMREALQDQIGPDLSAGLMIEKEKDKDAAEKHDEPPADGPPLEEKHDEPLAEAAAASEAYVLEPAEEVE